MASMEVVASLGEQLDYPPNDGVTSVQFATVSDQLLASSWDGVRVARAGRIKLYFAPQLVRLFQ